MQGCRGRWRRRIGGGWRKARSHFIMMTARHMQLCDFCVVRLLLRHRPSWMFKPLDSIITPGMADQSLYPIYVVLRTVGQSVLAEDLLAQFQVSSSLHEKANNGSSRQQPVSPSIHPIARDELDPSSSPYFHSRSNFMRLIFRSLYVVIVST